MNTFIKAITNKTQSSVTAMDGLKSTEVAIAMQNSIETKKVITL
jgi:myo-inositol 2-dehydrogenase/D-chiro-inositol 1-dehydrogenase